MISTSFHEILLITFRNFKGKTSKRKNFSIRALPELPPPIRATLPTFSGRQKQRFARMAEKILMMIIIVAMIILIKILVILMIMMKKILKNLQILLFLCKILPF